MVHFKKIALRAPWVFILLGSGVRVYTGYTVNPLNSLWSDPLRHWTWALHAITAQPMSGIDPKLYQAWLGIVAKVTQGTPVGIGIYAGLLSMITPWLWYRFFRELLPDRPTALWGWAILCWLPSWIGIFSYFMIETLLLPLLGLCFWLSLRCLRKGTLESFVWACLAWAAAMLTKVVVLPFAVLMIVWMWWQQPSRKRAVLSLAGILAASLIPAAYHTYHIAGTWEPFGSTKISEIYTASGNAIVQIQFLREGRPVDGAFFASPSTGDTRPFAPISDWHTARSGTCFIRADLSKGAEDWNKALAEYAPSWRLRLRNILENFVFMYWGPSWPDRMPTHFWENVAEQGRWAWAPLVLLVMWGNVYWFLRARSFHWIPLFTILGWFVLPASPYAIIEGRYRKPFEGILITNALWLTGIIGASKRMKKTMGVKDHFSTSKAMTSW